MKEDFVPYDIAVKLKEKGFKEKCFAYYFPDGSELCFNKNPFRGGIVEDCLYSNNSLPAECVASDFIDIPTISQVLKWLRKEKKIFVDVNSFPTYSTKEMVAYAVDVRCNSVGYSMETVKSAKSFARWEEAAVAGIEYVLNNLI